MNRRSHNHRHRRRRNNGLKKVKEDIKWLKQNIEFKFQNSNDELIADDEGEVDCLNDAIIGGTTLSQRIGEELTARRIFIRGFVHNDRGTPADGTIRIIVFRQKASLTTLPTVAEVLDPAFTFPTNAFRQMDNKEDIVVYADHTVSYDTLAHTIIPFKFIFKLAHQVKYTEVTAQVPQTNAMCLLAVSDQATTANAPGVSVSARYSYIDS